MLIKTDYTANPDEESLLLCVMAALGVDQVTLTEHLILTTEDRCANKKIVLYQDEENRKVLIRAEDK